MHELDVQNEKQNETHETVASYAWIGSGIVLLFLDEQFSLLSWQSLLFFIVGPFIAAVLLGWVFWGTQRGLAKALKLFVSQTSSGVAGVSEVVGVALTMLNVGITFVVAKYAVALMT